jgi:3-oxoadipate enol-lactonase
MALDVSCRPRRAKGSEAAVPDVSISDDLTLHCRIDDFTDPWVPSEAVMFIHGLAESGEVWFAWVPHFARRYRVLRPDLRGFGRSTVPLRPLEFPWSPALWADDLERLLDRLGISSVHLVGARVGSTVALTLAALAPKRVRTVSIVSGLARGRDLLGLTPAAGRPPIAVADAPATIAELGLREYVIRTNQARLGSAAPSELVDWSTDLQASSTPEVVRAVLRAASGLDLSDLLPRISAPTLVLAARESVVQTLDATRGWQSLIPDSELESMDGDSPHLAALYPDACAERVLCFLRRRATGPEPGA